MDFLPSLSSYDVDRAAQLIQQAYSPTQSTSSPDDLKRLQQDLFEIQKRPEAWGLVIPLLNHQDQNVQFFGAHTAQVKIARDWESFPNENSELLRDLIVNLTAHSISVGRNKVILRKLFVACPNAVGCSRPAWLDYKGKVSFRCQIFAGKIGRLWAKNHLASDGILKLENIGLASVETSFLTRSSFSSTQSAVLWEVITILRNPLQLPLTSLALKLAPGHPSRWPDWILASVSAFTAQGASTEHVHDFLTIVAEEVSNADLLAATKAQMNQTLLEALPIVLQAITNVITQPLGTAPTNHYVSALKCFQAWLGYLKGDHLTAIIPPLLSLLDPTLPDDAIFIGASDALQEVMTKSALSDGSGSKTLTEPLLVWCERVGRGIVAGMLSGSGSGSATSSSASTTFSVNGGVTDVSSGSVDLDVSPTGHSLCKLLVALGDHSTSYIASNIASTMPVSAASFPATLASSIGAQHQPNVYTKSHLVQTFLHLLLAFTALPGYYGVDEEESEMTLGFWYLLQEALWSTDFYEPEDSSASGDAGGGSSTGGEPSQVVVAKQVYSELVKVLRAKVAFPPTGSGWGKDQVEKFGVYRRDVGDTLINAYYVLRDDMVGYYVNDIAERLATRREGDGWQQIEATLHCILSIQEAIDVDKTLHLDRLFSPDILGRLPSSGRARVRRTALSVIGAYSSWFAARSQTPTTPSLTPLAHTPSSATVGLPPVGPTPTQPYQHNLSIPQQPQPQQQQQHQHLLLTVLGYVVSALPDPSLSLSAATALRNLCEANRKDLAVHIGAFGELHAGLNGIPDAEKPKVLQSIASVIQAMPPQEEISSIEAIVNPIIDKLYEALQNAATNQEDARTVTILQLETLSGVAKGLTRTVEGMTVYEDDSDPDVIAEAEKVRKAREDPRSEALRGRMFNAIGGVMELWSVDASVGQALSDLFKSITSLPSDITLLSLPPIPLLQLVCLATQRQLTASWLSLAAILIAQLNPPVFSLSLKSGPTREAVESVRNLLPVLLQTGLGFLGTEGGMVNNPDIVQEFFACMDRIAQDFTNSFFTLQPGLLDALVQCAIRSLSLQERYSLVSACGFLSTLINRSSLTDELNEHKAVLLASHGRSIMRAILEGFAGVAPRSVVPNLIELLGTLLSRATATSLGNDGGDSGAAQWMKEVLLSDDFVQSKAGPEVKAKFIKAVSGSRSLKRTRDAANQFTLVARGLEGSNFGYSTVTM